MGIFDIFSTGPAVAASGALNQGINTGLGTYNQYAGQGQTALNTNYASALQPFQQNYGTAAGGVSELGNLLGLGGASGNASALQSLQNTPGYQFQLQQGNNAVLANQAATGQLASGNTDLALQKYGQGLAGTTYQNAVQNLQPYLGMAQNSAQGIGGLYSGLGNQLNQSFQNQGQANYGANAAIGQSNANADLSAYAASGNLLNFGMNAAKMLSGMGGSGGFGNLFGGFGGQGSGGSGNLGGISSPTSGGFNPISFAEGGRPPPDQPSIVGERGPEIFVPDQPGTIVPNNFAAGLRPYLEGGATVSGPSWRDLASFNERFGDVPPSKSIVLPNTEKSPSASLQGYTMQDFFEKQRGQNPSALKGKTMQEFWLPTYKMPPPTALQGYTTQDFLGR